MKLASLSLVALATLASSLQWARGQVTIGSLSSNWGYFSGTQYNLAETFTVPAGNTTLETFVEGVEDQTNATFQATLFSWNTGNSSLGTQIWSGTGTSTSSGYTTIDYTVGETLSPGTTYAMVFTDSSNASGVSISNSSPYTGGSLYFTGAATPATGETFSQLSLQANFTATFDAGAVVTPVPETQSFVYAGLFLCGGLALWQSRRQMESGLKSQLARIIA